MYIYILNWWGFSFQQKQSLSLHENIKTLNTNMMLEIVENKLEQRNHRPLRTHSGHLMLSLPL